MMNKTNEGIFGDPTTQFNFCLHDKLNSVQNCTNGLFVSLPLLTQQYLWSRIFDNVSEIDVANENKTKNEKQDSVSVHVVILVTALIVLAGVLVSVLLYIGLRYFKKVWKKNTIIRVPEIEDDKFHVKMHVLGEENLSKENNETSTLLQYEKEMDIDDTSTGYGSESSVLTEHCSLPNILESGYIKTHTGNSFPVVKGNLTLPDETPHSSVSVKYEKMSETLDSFIAKEKVADNNVVVKTKITVLQSPNKNIDQGGCSTIAENSNGVSVLEGTNLEIERLDWSRIFLFLIKQIDPKIYELFFTILLENARARNVNNIIESVKRETNSVMSTLFELFKRWRYGAGSSAKPKDIEDVFETLEWNAQLKDFREFMRNPPYLPDNRSWTNFSISDCRTVETGQMFLQQPQLFQIQDSEGRSQIRDLSLHSESIEENVSVTNINNDRVYKSHRNIRRRTCHDDSEVKHDVTSSSFTAGRVVCSSGYGSLQTTYNGITSFLNVSNHTCDEGLPESISKPESSEFLSKPLSFSENGNCQYHRQPQITMKFKRSGKRWNVCPNPRTKRKQNRQKQETGKKNSFKQDGETPFKNWRNQKGCKQTKIFLDDAVTEAIIRDLLDRLTPKREDVVSLRFRAYRDADCLITSWNEKIFVISSSRQSMLLRENEWNTIRNYVNTVRKLL